MATRYYTSEAYEQIKQTIEQIDNDDVNPVVDFIGDLISRIAQHLELFSVDDYQNDMQTWYNIVLDSHNSTINAVDTIFENVGEVDTAHSQILEDALSSIENFRNSLNCLRDVISEKTSLADGKAAAAGYLADGKSALNNAYAKILTKMEASVLRGAGKELVGDGLKLGAGFLKVLTEKNPVKFAVECKKFLDTFTAYLGDLGAVASVTILTPIAAYAGKKWLGMSEGNILDFRFDQLMQAKDYKDKNSVSDWLGIIAEDLEADVTKCPENHPYYTVAKFASEFSQITSKGSDVADLVVDAYGILDDLKDTHDLFYGEYYSKEEYLEVIENKGKVLEIIEDYNGPIYRVRGTASEIVGKVISNLTSIPISDWDDSSKKAGNVYKTFGTIWSYAEAFIPNPGDGTSAEKDWMDVLGSKIKEVGFLKDVFDFARDLDEFATKEPPEVSRKAQCGTASSNWFQCEIGVK